MKGLRILIRDLSKWGWQWIYFILLSISLLWLPCMFLFSLKFPWLQRLLLSETMDVSSWNVSHVFKTAWKWSSWSLIWEQDGTNVSFISHIHVRFLSSVISLIVLPTLPSPSSAVLQSLLSFTKPHSNKALTLLMEWDWNRQWHCMSAKMYLPYCVLRAFDIFFSQNTKNN